LNPEPPKQESAGRKIILAPFRFMGEVINGIGKALGPFGRFLLEVVRVIFGLIIFFIGMVVILTPLLMLGVYWELFNNEDWTYMFGTIPFDTIAELLPVWLVIAVAVAILIPGVVLTLLGISVLIKRSLIDARFGLVTFGLWILSLMICAFQVPRVVNQFKDDASFVKEEVLEMREGTLVIQSQNNAPDADLGLISISLEGTPDSTLVLLQEFRSQGKNHDDALTNASSVSYDYSLEDTVLLLNRSLEFTADSKFRAQSLHQTLKVPYNTPFVMDKSLLPILERTIYTNGYKMKDVNSRNHWVFNENGLLCLNCVNDHKNSQEDSISRAMFSGRYFME